MKLPKSFRPKKGLDESIRKLVEDSPKERRKYNHQVVNKLFESFDDYFNVVLDSVNNMPYISLNIIKKVEKDFISKISYSKYDLQKLCRSLTISDPYKDQFLGIYITYLTNRITSKGDKIVLPFDNNQSASLLGLGAYLHKDITLVIDGDVKDSAGLEMRSGKLVVMGNAGWYLGERMHGGNIEVMGKADFDIGYMSESGKIIVHGNIDSVYRRGCKAEVYNGKRRIWPK